MQNKNQRHKNNLFEARHRCGIEAKQVSYLLGKSSAEQLYRYESGRYQPNLITLFKLAIIYRTPPHYLYQKLYEQLRDEIAQRRIENLSLFSELEYLPTNAGQVKQSEHCFYKEILMNHPPSEFELEMISKHIISMMNIVSDYKQGRNPFSLS